MDNRIGNLINASDIYTEQGIREQILGYTDWAGLETTPISYATILKLGAITTVNNPKLEFNNVVGFKAKYLLIANNATALADTGGTVSLNFTTTFGANTKNNFRVGNILTFTGHTGTTYASMEQVQVQIVGEGSDINSWAVKTLHSTTGGTTTFDFDSTAGIASALVSTSENYAGQAPESMSLSPTQDENWVQLFRAPYGVDNMLESQDNLFGNIRGNTSKEAEDYLYKMINQSIGYNLVTLKMGATAGGVTGMDKYEGVMKGIPGFLSCTNLGAAANTTPYAKALAPATDNAPTAAEANVIWAALEDLADQFGGNTYTFAAFTSTSMRRLIRHCALINNTIMTTGKVIIPGYEIYFEEIKIGTITFRMIVDGQYDDEAAPFIFDGTNHVYKNYFMFLVNMKHTGTAYHRRKDYGIMAPKDHLIEQVRNQYKYEGEWVGELTLGMKQLHKHGVFYLKKVDA